MKNRDKLAKSNLVWVIIGSLLLMALLILLIISLVSTHKNETTGEKDIKIVQSLTCESDEFVYPFFEYDGSTSKEFKIIITFEDEKIHSLSLRYILYYDDEESINYNDNFNHAAMNLSFYERGLDSDAINATYSRLSDAYKMNLYEDAANLTEPEKEYFLLDGISEYNTTTISHQYNQLGLDCVIAK